MDEENIEKQIPCIVGTGVITSKRDMIRVLRGFDHVKYTELIDGHVEIEDESYVVEVFSSTTESTIIFNRRMYINVNNFEYLKIKKSLPGIIELIEGHRTIRLEALSDPLSNKEMLLNEAVENRSNFDTIYEEDIILDEDY